MLDAPPRPIRQEGEDIPPEDLTYVFERFYSRPRAVRLIIGFTLC
ncbi:MAG: hypothetical protein Kow00124_26750 [Anaerolineae bacterium]